VVDNSRALAATLVGAVLGAIAGYLFFTEHGRTLRRRFEPALDDVAHELNSFRTTVQKAANVANEGWKLFGDALNEGAERQPRYPTPHQTSPY
jgi:gas vesicle protein